MVSRYYQSKKQHRGKRKKRRAPKPTSNTPYPLPTNPHSTLTESKSTGCSLSIEPSRPQQLLTAPHFPHIGSAAGPSSMHTGVVGVDASCVHVDAVAFLTSLPESTKLSIAKGMLVGSNSNRSLPNIHAGNQHTASLVRRTTLTLNASVTGEDEALDPDFPPLVVPDADLYRRISSASVSTSTFVTKAGRGLHSTVSPLLSDTDSDNDTEYVKSRGPTGLVNWNAVSHSNNGGSAGEHPRLSKEEIVQLATNENEHPRLSKQDIFQLVTNDDFAAHMPTRILCGLKENKDTEQAMLSLCQMADEDPIKNTYAGGFPGRALGQLARTCSPSKGWRMNTSLNTAIHMYRQLL